MSFSAICCCSLYPSCMVTETGPVFIILYLQRNVHTLEKLDLNDISHLSDKLLANMFTELNSDEIRKSFTVQCALMPDTCAHEVTVFGSEMKGRFIMIAHLREHIKGLKKQQEGTHL